LVMMGRQTSDQSRLFYAFNLDELIPERHLLRQINPIVTRRTTLRRHPDLVGPADAPLRAF